MAGLLRGVARTAVVAGTATSVSNRVSRRQSHRWSKQEAQEQPDDAAQQEVSADDDTAQLEKLAQLHDRGILTDEEFAAKKKQILNI